MPRGDVAGPPEGSTGIGGHTGQQRGVQDGGTSRPVGSAGGVSMHGGGQVMLSGAVAAPPDGSSGIGRQGGGQSGRGRRPSSMPGIGAGTLQTGGHAGAIDGASPPSACGISGHREIGGAAGPVQMTRSSARRAHEYGPRDGVTHRSVGPQWMAGGSGGEKQTSPMHSVSGVAQA